MGDVQLDFTHYRARHMDINVNVLTIIIYAATELLRGIGGLRERDFLNWLAYLKTKATKTDSSALAYSLTIKLYLELARPGTTPIPSKVYDPPVHLQQSIFPKEDDYHRYHFFRLLLIQASNQSLRFIPRNLEDGAHHIVTSGSEMPSGSNMWKGHSVSCPVGIESCDLSNDSALCTD